MKFGLTPKLKPLPRPFVLPVYILYCASGGRSALSGKVLKEMGYHEVYNLGAFKDWAEGGGAVDKPLQPRI